MSAATGKADPSPFTAFRRVATRYEQLPEHDLAMVTIAAILLWLCFAHTP